MIPPPRRYAWMAGLICGAISLAFSLLLLIVFRPPALPELLLGWLCACLNGAANAAINARAVGKEPSRFLVWGIVMNSLRLATVLASLLAVCFLTNLAFAPFAVALAASAIVFLTGGALAMAGRDDEGR